MGMFLFEGINLCSCFTVLLLEKMVALVGSSMSCLVGSAVGLLFLLLENGCCCCVVVVVVLLCCCCCVSLSLNWQAIERMGAFLSCSLASCSSLMS